VTVKKKVYGLTLAFALLFSAVAGTHLVNLVSAQSFMTIIIKADGSIDPSTAPITQTGNVYALTNNILGTITIENDNIIIEGAGYTLRGNGTSTGIFLQSRTNITIKNMKISNFAYGIQLTPIYLLTQYFGECEKITISGNTISNNDVGMSCEHASNTAFYGNYLQNNSIGLSISSASSNVLRDNHMSNNERNLITAKYNLAGDINDDIDVSNTVDGKPICYLINKHNMAVPSDAGMVALLNCSGITVQSLTLSNNGQGLWLVQTTNSIISQNLVANNTGGISLVGSSNNSIIGNIVINNKVMGISVFMSSNNNFIAENKIATCEQGISLRSSNGNIVTKNSIFNTQQNIPTFDAENNSVFDNEFASEVPEFPSIPPPTPTLSPTPTPTPTHTPTPEPFLTAIVVATAVTVAVIGVGLLVYFKKRNNDRTNKHSETAQSPS
jgi:parallel beta-helix repeat protein